MADQRRDIDPDAALSQGVQVLTHGAPGHVDTPRFEGGALLLGDQPVARRGREAAVADDFGRHPLTDLALSGWVGQQRPIEWVCMSMKRAPERDRGRR